jgi:hypothetical protein
MSAVEKAGAILWSGLSAPLGCSGAQVQAWKGGLADLTDCVLGCGVSAGQFALTETIKGVQIDGPGIGRGALGCVVPCLIRFGGVAVEVVAGGATRYGGSAGEANVYQPDTYILTITPRK